MTRRKVCISVAPPHDGLRDEGVAARRPSEPRLDDEVLRDDVRHDADD